MAMSEAAIPPELARNSRRLTPSFFEASAASSLIRASTCCCFSVCGFGRYSPFDTFWVGIGEQNSSDSTSYAREHLLSSSGLIHVESDIAHPSSSFETNWDKRLKTTTTAERGFLRLTHLLFPDSNWQRARGPTDVGTLPERGWQTNSPAGRSLHSVYCK